MNNNTETLINRAKHIIENGGLLARDTSLALIAALEKTQAKAVERGHSSCDLFGEVITLRERIAELEPGQLAVKIPPHKYRECVNGLLEEAIAYAGTQQLRARLSARLSNFVKPDNGGTVQGDE